MNRQRVACQSNINVSPKIHSCECPAMEPILTRRLKRQRRLAAHIMRSRSTPSRRGRRSCEQHRMPRNGAPRRPMPGCRSPSVATIVCLTDQILRGGCVPGRACRQRIGTSVTRQAQPAPRPVWSEIAGSQCATFLPLHHAGRAGRRSAGHASPC